MINNPFGKLNQDSVILESTWTLLPIIILITIIRPRIILLCWQDSISTIPNSTLKLISNQWNWQIEEEEIITDLLLDTDEVINLFNYETPVTFTRGLSRITITSTDVLHSLGIPNLGLKLDSIPGRLNTTVVDTNRIGLIRGACYELCGRGHRAIPITILVL